MPLSFLHDLPARTESTLNGVIQAIELNDPITHQGCSSLEAPSAVAVIYQLCGREIPIDFADIPSPDPRLPIREVPFVTWTYRQDGSGLTTQADPALRKPSAQTASLVASIATNNYELSAWSADAAAIMTRQPTLDALEVLGVMVHPPAGPEGFTLWDWRFRVQVASALLLARITPPWEGGALSTLNALLDGPVDWTTTASTIGLLDLARREEGLRGEILRCLLVSNQREMSPIWFSCGFLPAMHALLDVPGIPPGVLTSIRAAVEATEQEDDQG